MRYIFIFHINNAALIYDDFWHTFINTWIFSATFITNSVNLILPGFYSYAYVMCTCTSQDYSQQPKFESTSMVLTLVTVALYTFVSVKIKIYKSKAIHPEHHPKNTLGEKNKQITDIIITVGPGLLFIIVFLVIYILGKTRSMISTTQFPNYLIIQVNVLIVIPLIFNIFVTLFYFKNKHVAKYLLREWNNHEM